MHRLTNVDADRLASTLHTAALVCRTTSAEAYDVAQAAQAIGSVAIAMAWTSRAESARMSAEELEDVARRLRTRIPLWDNETHVPKDKGGRLTAEGRRAIGAARRQAG